MRFPCFDQPYTVSPLSNYLFENTERNRDLLFDKEDVLSVSGEFGVVNQIEFQGRSFAGESVAEYHVVDTNDVVYTKSPLKANPYGIIKTNKGVPGIVSTLYAVYHPKECTDPLYVEYYFGNDLRLNKFLKPLVNIGAKHDMKVNNEFVLTGEVCFPSVIEQRKVVQFLSFLDQRIEKQRSLVKHLKKYKRGVMREIFETKTLFSSHHYSIVQLGNECRFFSGGTPQSGNSKYYGGSIPFIRSGEVHKSITELTLTEEGLNNSSAKMVEVGDLIMALYGATSGEVDISKISGAINQAILCIRPNTINRHYLKFLFECKKEDILKTYLQGGQGNLSAEIIKKLYFEIPLPSEQQETVDFLVALENKISLEDSKLEKLFSVRNGLLQRLFI